MHITMQNINDLWSIAGAVTGTFIMIMLPLFALFIFLPVIVKRCSKAFFDGRAESLNEKNS